MTERDDYYGIHAEEFLGLTEHCTERNCRGVMQSNGYLRFSRRRPPEIGWFLEFECPQCGLVALFARKDDLPLVQKVLRPLVDS